MAGLAKCIIISLYFRLDVECMELEAIIVVWCIYNCNCYSEHKFFEKRHACMHDFLHSFFTILCDIDSVQNEIQTHTRLLKIIKKV
ncbi:hypothetical protein GLYMA_06G168800v4 [Glycine max]|uniref:Secreted protein n=1 Tax=Glycine max TaxID=3847 RepID=A0A0R0JHZ5_SOYBN|nr:hypothetical protein GLYMA_06G168800v4 [Glycine max]